MQPSTRPLALAAGSKTFFNGVPCKHGHVAERVSSNGGCSVCTRSRVAAWQKANPERRRYNANRWAQKAREDSGRLLAISEQKRRFAAGPKGRAADARRRASQLHATPRWLTQAMEAEIEGIYHFAQVMRAITGVLYDVDHIVPLQASGARGLHVPWNLEAIPASVNRSKQNRFQEF